MRTAASTIISCSLSPLDWGCSQPSFWRSSFIPRPRNRYPKRFPFLSTKARAAVLSLAVSSQWLACLAAATQDPAADAEIDGHLTTVREQVSNTFLDLARREELALEMAGTLDRA